jgi:hypothetical protein
VQKYTTDDKNGRGKTRLIGGRMVKQLQVIITILDHSTLGGNSLPLQFTGVIIHLMQYQNNNRLYPVHGITKVKY